MGLRLHPEHPSPGRSDGLTLPFSSDYHLPACTWYCHHMLGQFILCHVYQTYFPVDRWNYTQPADENLLPRREFFCAGEDGTRMGLDTPDLVEVGVAVRLRRAGL